MIRPATAADIPRIVELGRQLHGMSRYASLAFDPDKVADTLQQLMDGQGVVFVAERGGRVIGGFAGGLTEQWFSRELVAFDYSFFVEPQSRHGITAAKLATAFLEWAKARGARQVCLGITTGLDEAATARFYRALGFAPAGQLFKREV